MKNKKYELIMNDIITINGDKTLYRIRALKNFDNIRVGELGGYVSGYHNLSQEGGCWIYHDAMVYDTAKVFDNARVYHDAMIYDTAKVFDNAEVYDNAIVFGNARVYGNANVNDDAMIYDGAKVYDAARIFGYARVCGDSNVSGHAMIYDGAKVCGHAMIYENSEIYGDVIINGDAKISNNADISSDNDYLYIKGLGSVNRFTTAFKLSDESIYVHCGCFEGALDEFESKVNDTHGDNKYGKEYKAFINVIKIHFGLI